MPFRACLHGGGGPQEGEVTRLSISSIILIWSHLLDWLVTRRGLPQGESMAGRGLFVNCVIWFVSDIGYWYLDGYGKKPPCSYTINPL